MKTYDDTYCYQITTDGVAFRVERTERYTTTPSCYDDYEPCSPELDTLGAAKRHLKRLITPRPWRKVKLT